MQNIFEIPTAQQLRFVNRKYYETTKNTLDTRLWPDIEFTDRDFVSYCQMVQNDDPVWIQLYTSYIDFSVKLVKADDWTKTTLTPTPGYSWTLDDGTELQYYNFDVDVSSLIGQYYIEIETADPEKPYFLSWSEKMDIQEEHEGTKSIEWGGNSGISDGMRWATVAYEIDRYQQIRIDARIIEPIHGTLKSTYDDSDVELTTLKADPIRNDVLDIELIPFYLEEKINLALGHDEFKIDEQLYNIEEDFELTNNKNQLTRTGNITLRKVVYENNNDYEEITGDYPEPETGNLLISGTDNLLINATDKLKIA